MINYTLHKLKERFIVTSDEEIKPGEWCYSVEHNKLWQRSMSFHKKEEDNVFCSKFPSYLLIANSDTSHISQKPQIDFSDLAEEEQKKIGWFDVEKLSRETVLEIIGQHNIKSSTAKDMIDVGITMFQKAQEISNELFTLEIEKLKSDLKHDLKESVSTVNIQMIEGALWGLKKLTQSLSQPKSWKVEIETEPYTVGEMSKLPLGTINSKLKLTNGKIKILKVLD